MALQGPPAKQEARLSQLVGGFTVLSLSKCLYLREIGCGLKFQATSKPHHALRPREELKRRPGSQGSHFGRVPLAILCHAGCRDAFLVAACHGEKLGDFPIKEAWSPWSSRFLERHLPMIFGFPFWDGRPSRM